VEFVRWDSFVAVGDSFTEGLDDPYPDRSSYRGWADRVAEALARDGFTYANLAIRGRLLGQVVDEQVPAALAMSPALVSFAAGVNDALRRRFDPVTLLARFDATVARLRASGADVILFRSADTAYRLPGQRLVAPRLAVLNQAVARAAERHGAILVDLSTDEAFRHPGLWSIDRLHLSPEGHQRVAAHVLTALGLEPPAEWWRVPAPPPARSWLVARGEDLTWAGRHLVPWVRRRVTGRSSGDGLVAKRPALAPVAAVERSFNHGEVRE